MSPGRKPKKKGKQALTKELDRVFSRWVRYGAVGPDGLVKCFTCDYRNEPKKLQAGHWIPRQHMATRWEHWNVHPQCYACNMYYGGRPQEYREQLVNEWGEETVAEYALRRHQVRIWSLLELQELIDVYKGYLKDMDCG